MNDQLIIDEDLPQVIDLVIDHIATELSKILIKVFFYLVYRLVINEGDAHMIIQIRLKLHNNITWH